MSTPTNPASTLTARIQHAGDRVRFLARQSILDVVDERMTQDARRDDVNEDSGYSVDQYILHYVGDATISSHNLADQKRTNLVKAAAVLLQIVDRLDEGHLLLLPKEPKVG